MPGWYIHMDAARKALSALSSNAGAAGLFGELGPTADELSQIATSNPAYTALGAIGPDLFFLLPDFKPPLGNMLYGAANTIQELFTWLDENFLGPWEDQIGPIEDNTSDEVAAITGDLTTQINAIQSKFTSFLLDAVVVLASRTHDIFSILSSGVPAGYDEKVFFWSDMLHYRKTYHFAAYLWQKATAAGNPRFQAYALGWMTHVATDVVGHCFVNEKAGGPYRLHWQRHHLVENHMDAKVYDSERGGMPQYEMLSDAALHLWIAFNGDASSRVDFFQAQPGPSYPTGDRTPDLLGRTKAWDVDSDLPADLGDFVAAALREVYNDAVTATADPKGQAAAHPTIWDSIVPGTAGYIKGQDVVNTYWWLYHYTKWTTTDYYKIRRPSPPDAVIVAPFPSPPGAGTSDPGPGPSDDSTWHCFLETLLAIFCLDHLHRSDRRVAGHGARRSDHLRGHLSDSRAALRVCRAAALQRLAGDPLVPGDDWLHLSHEGRDECGPQHPGRGRWSFLAGGATSARRSIGRDSIAEHRVRALGIRWRAKLSNRCGHGPAGLFRERDRHGAAEFLPRLRAAQRVPASVALAVGGQ